MLFVNQGVGSIVSLFSRKATGVFQKKAGMRGSKDLSTYLKTAT